LNGSRDRFNGYRNTFFLSPDTFRASGDAFCGQRMKTPALQPLFNPSHTTLLQDDKLPCSQLHTIKYKKLPQRNGDLFFFVFCALILAQQERLTDIMELAQGLHLAIVQFFCQKKEKIGALKGIFERTVGLEARQIELFGDLIQVAGQ
jgi:hypothetical protein